ncbi:unnamed protein product [Paramecium octaurelia]|uniref:Uncharacterized protein n=1 Tax=Paramecium octaurelia TaxID=43137 RepID=A0A8S1V194_PAROT|nr:unnamed protein product [Paramecium octaurelia]
MMLSEPCHIVAINKFIQILAVICRKTITIFKFRLGFLKLAQILIEHTNYLSNQLISFGNNQSIFYWRGNKKLEGHFSFIS